MGIEMCIASMGMAMAVGVVAIGTAAVCNCFYNYVTAAISKLTAVIFLISNIVATAVIFAISNVTSVNYGNSCYCNYVIPLPLVM